jgi:L-iditol 2-dehydrogenase
MRIAQLIAPRRFRLIEEPIADPGPGEIQARIEYIGICGSDLHAYMDGAVGGTPTRLPAVLGHEPAGSVVKTGPGVAGWAPGDRAYLEPAIYCYHCESCRAGRHNVCENIRFLSAAADPGFFREYVNLPAANLMRLPEGLSTRDATLIEPLAVALHSMTLATPQLGETVVVFGAGPIGLCTIACLRLSGVRRVWAVEPVAHRREMALQQGADAAIDPNAADPVAEILRETGNRGVDLAIDCAAYDDTVNQCIRAARRAGRVVLTGIPVAAMCPLDITRMRLNEIALFNVRRSNRNDPVALALLVEHLPRLAAMITHTFPLECIADAFAVCEARADGAGKIMIAPV